MQNTIENFVLFLKCYHFSLDFYVALQLDPIEHDHTLKFMQFFCPKIVNCVEQHLKQNIKHSVFYCLPTTIYKSPNFLPAHY